MNVTVRPDNSRLRNNRNGCGACARARGVLNADLAGKKATVVNPAILVHLSEWANQ